MTTRPATDHRTSAPRTVTRVLLGAFLTFAGLSHLFWAREEFRAQVPTWVPLDVDAVVLASGVVEVVLGVLLLSGWRRTVVGWIVAAFFVAVFPGNVSQYLTGTDAFGLDSDNARAIRLLFQPLLIGWALWSTGAWAAWRDRARPSRAA
ncbi:DoxX family protein [Rhodococcoides kroppenstedtii]|uniref:DoxX family protein n=1 Tax=Rhodococcoides kroppenstedtii TaxID=293050 RepID=UPI001BDE1683|nr:DoxX family membrane protein [Rhodococcus kroppenstedtii]MBT1191977.1 DoxX family membrane protein [Rhodococcus kroppenstedtii]